jgi:sulfate adenylyltransferase
MRLRSGALWPIPVTLDVSADFAAKLEIGGRVALRDPENVVLALLEVQSIWQPDKSREAEKVFGTDDKAHPAVRYLHDKAGTHYVGGKVIGLQEPNHYDFRERRHSPNELKALFKQWGWDKIVAFQTRNPLHRAHQELTLRASRQVGANLLIHPVVGMTKPGDVDHYTRVRCYEALLPHYPQGRAAMSLLGLAMRMGGPREALWHAIIRRNFGCTHFIVGRDHAGPGNDSQGKPFYGPYDAQELVKQHEAEIGIEMVPFKEMVYLQNRHQYAPVDEIQPGEAILNISGTELRRRLQEGEEIPEWFSFPSVIAELRRTHPPRRRQGFTVFFTGLSGAGKSTIANALMAKLMQVGGRSVTLLDGDAVRKHLSSELGFSKEHRNLNILRIGYVASEITKNGGIAICAPIAPYAATRREVRDMIEPLGGFIEVHVATPLAECERRDRKGLYKLAREGKLKQFTGIDDPYEAPEAPEVSLDTLGLSPDQAADAILAKLTEMGLIAPASAFDETAAPVAISA